VAIRVSPGVESVRGELPVWERQKEDEQMAVEEVGEECRCNVCGNDVTLNKVGGGTLVCCSQDMEQIGWTLQTQMECNNDDLRQLVVERNQVAIGETKHAWE
jgi:superoxide reductase